MAWQFVDDAVRMARPFLGKAVQAGKGLWAQAGPGAQKVIQTVGPSAAAGGVVGGVRGAQQGGVGNIISGTLGGAVGGGLTGSIPGVKGLNPYAQAAIGAGGGLYGPQLMGATGNVVQQGAGAGALQMQNVPNVNPSAAYPGGGSPVPNIGGVQGQMIIGPDGNIYQQIDPTGYRAGARMGSGLDTMQNISNYNRWADARFGERERIRKADLEREIAAQQLRRNMDLAFNISNRSHATTSNIAEKAAEAQGNLMNSNVRYF